MVAILLNSPEHDSGRVLFVGLLMTNVLLSRPVVSLVMAVKVNKIAKDWLLGVLWLMTIHLSQTTHPSNDYILRKTTHLCLKRVLPVANKASIDRFR